MPTDPELVEAARARAELSLVDMTGRAPAHPALAAKAGVVAAAEAADAATFRAADGSRRWLVGGSAQHEACAADEDGAAVAAATTVTPSRGAGAPGCSPAGAFVDLPDDALLLIARTHLPGALALRSTCKAMQSRLHEFGRDAANRRRAEAGRSKAELRLVSMANRKSEVDLAAERAIARLAAAGIAPGAGGPPGPGGGAGAVTVAAADAAAAATFTAAAHAGAAEGGWFVGAPSVPIVQGEPAHEEPEAVAATAAGGAAAPARGARRSALSGLASRFGKAVRL